MSKPNNKPMRWGRVAHKIERSWFKPLIICIVPILHWIFTGEMELKQTPVALYTHYFLLAVYAMSMLGPIPKYSNDYSLWKNHQKHPVSNKTKMSEVYCRAFKGTLPKKIYRVEDVTIFVYGKIFRRNHIFLVLERKQDELAR